MALVSGTRTSLGSAIVNQESGTTCDAALGGSDEVEIPAFVAVFSAREVRVVPLPPSRTISAGRSRSCEIQFDDPAASRVHLTFEWNGGEEVVVHDRESRNGTSVDGTRLTGRTVVRTGAEIRVGATRMLVVVRNDAGLDDASLSPIDDQDLVARAPAMLAAVAMADRAARSDATVLVLGETGVGKEIIARRIHRSSTRERRPFIAVNCAAIPETLAESILFGHERGSFTGAQKQQRGVFEDASSGTLFLDEIGELSPSTQARLLRVLQDRTVTRLGSTSPVPVDVRLIAATHRDLHALADQGGFRKDLIYRLDVVRIEIPALRDRPEDVLPIAERILRELAPKRSIRLSAMAKRALLAYTWPGNVRELRNRLEAAVATGDGDVIEESDLRAILPAKGGPGEGPLRGHVEDAEREAIIEALRACGGNQTRVAERLGVSRRTLVYRLGKYDLHTVAFEARRRPR